MPRTPTIPLDLEELLLELRPGQALLVECQTRDKAVNLRRRLNRYLEYARNQGILQFSYLCKLRRLGGDEYAVLVQCTKPSRALLLETKEDGSTEVIKQKEVAL